MLDYKEFEDGHFVEVVIDGEVSSEEIQAMWQKLRPTLESWGKAGVIKEVRSIPKIGLKALLSNFTNGLPNFLKFDRVAVLTDKDWVKTVSEVFASIGPMKVEVFSLDEKEKARLWMRDQVSGGK